MTTEQTINGLIDDLESPSIPRTSIAKMVRLLEFLRDEPYELMGLTEVDISEAIHRLLE